jgi:flagellar basal-body rod protein FlgB
VLSDVTSATIHQALRGLSARQRAISDNVANLETPGYLAKRVDFESSLQAALSDGDPVTAQPVESTSRAATGVNGNNVNLDEETLTSLDTNLRYQLMVNAINAKANGLRTAMRTY